MNNSRKHLIRALILAAGMSGASAFAGNVYKLPVPNLRVTAPSTNPGGGTPEVPPPTPQPGYLQLSAASLDLGSALLGQSTTNALTLSNPGKTAVSVTGVAASGSEFVARGCSGSLAAGASCQLSVDFTPAAAGNRAASISISSSAGGSSVALTGFGQWLHAFLSPTAATAFGIVKVGATSPAQTFTLTNDGNIPVSDIRVGLNGGTTLRASGFSITNGCAATLAPGASCGVQAVFSPTGKGAVTATLGIQSSAQDSTLNLSGDGRALLLALQDNTGAPLTTLDFDSVNADTTKMVRIANPSTSSGDLRVTGVSVTGIPFTVATSTSVGGALCTSLTSMTIPPGAACEVAVKVTAPQDGGDYTTGFSMTVRSDASESTPAGGGAVELPIKAIVTPYDQYLAQVMVDLQGNAGAIVDYGKAAATRTNSGVTISTSPTKVAPSNLYFNGSSFMTLAGASLALGAGDFTVEGWVYPTASNNGDLIIQNSGVGVRIRLIGSNFQMYDGGSGVYNAPATYNAWQHIAAVRKNGVITLYKNGAATVSFADARTFTTTSYTMGKTPANSATMTGNLDQFRITKAARYSGAFTPSVKVNPR